MGHTLYASVGHRALAAIWGEVTTVSCTPCISPCLGSKRSFSPKFSQLVKTVRENKPQIFIPGAQSPVVPQSGSAALLFLWSLACEPDCLRRRLPFPKVLGKDRRPKPPRSREVLGWQAVRPDESGLTVAEAPVLPYAKGVRQPRLGSEGSRPRATFVPPFALRLQRCGGRNSPQTSLPAAARGTPPAAGAIFMFSTQMGHSQSTFL